MRSFFRIFSFLQRITKKYRNLRIRNITNIRKNTTIQKIFTKKKKERFDDSPSRDVLGIFAGTAAIGITDLEHSADRAPVLSRDTFQTYVILSAIVGMGVSAEAAGCPAHFAGGWTRETSCDFWR